MSSEKKSADYRRMAAAGQAIKAGEYKKAKRYLEQVTDRKYHDRAQSALKKVNRRLEGESAASRQTSNKNVKSKAKPVEKKKPNWIRRIVIGVLAIIIVSSGALLFVASQVNPIFQKVTLEAFCENIVGNNKDCEVWANTIIQDEQLKELSSPCAVSEAYGKWDILGVCLLEKGITVIGTQILVTPLDYTRIGDSANTAIAKLNIYCQNWRNEDYCTVWSWHTYSQNADASVACEHEYPTVQELIGFQRCIEPFAPLDV